jgi:hypothetical protein
VIPVFDEQGRVTEMYGRKVHDNLRKGTPKHLYLPGPHRGIWNLDAFKSSKEIILCESLIVQLAYKSSITRPACAAGCVALSAGDAVRQHASIGPSRCDRARGR